MADSAVRIRAALMRKQKVEDEPSGKRSRGREKIDDETLASRHSRETQSSRRSSSTPRSSSGKKSSSTRSLTGRREDDASSANRMALTAAHLSTAEGDNDRDAKSSSLERDESSSRRPLESPRKRTEKMSDSPRVRSEKPPESPRKKAESSKRLSSDSSKKTPTSARKQIVELPPRTKSPRKRTENPTDSPRLGGERPPEPARKTTESSNRLSLDSPIKTPSTPGKKIVETPRKTTESQRKTIPSSPRKTPDSQRNRVSDSPKKSASDSPRKTSSVSLLTGKQDPTKYSPPREKSVSLRKLSSFESKSTSRLIPPDQSLLEDLTQKLLIDSIDAMRGPETFKAAKTNEVIKKHIQDVAMTGAKQKESASSTSRASPDGLFSSKELNRRKEESKPGVEGQIAGQSSADRIVRQIVSEHWDSQKKLVARTEIAGSEAQDHRLQKGPSGRAERITI
jgi:hypothetical protein